MVILTPARFNTILKSISKLDDVRPNQAEQLVLREHIVALSSVLSDKPINTITYIPNLNITSPVSTILTHRTELGDDDGISAPEELKDSLDAKQLAVTHISTLLSYLGYSKPSKGGLFTDLKSADEDPACIVHTCTNAPVYDWRK